MGTPNGYPQPVSRHPTELTAEQQEALDALVRVVERNRRGEAEYTERLVACKKAEVPIKRIADAVGVERKTIYNQLGRTEA